MKYKTFDMGVAYKASNAVQLETRVYAEWNMNRLMGSTVTSSETNVPADWESYCPLSSVTEIARPTQGIVKARLTSLQGVFGEDRAQAVGLKVANDLVNFQPPVRQYIPTVDDYYKYWQSYQTTYGTSNSNGKFSFKDLVTLTMVYDAPVKTNKITISLEASEAIPVSPDVFITTNGTSWRLIASNPNITKDGQIIIWYGDDWIPSGEMPTNFKNSQSTTIKGIRLTVGGMNKYGAPLGVIEMAASYYQDLTPYVVSESSDFELSDTSNIAPVGASSSNKANVKLDNTNKWFYNENPDSPYYKLLDKNVKMWCDYIFAGKAVRQWTMFTDDWSNQMSEEVTVDLYDNAEYLQNIKVPAVFWQNITVGSAIWRLLDMAGISGWRYSAFLNDTTDLPFYWIDPDSTVWENINNLAKATQTVVYFDSYNVAQIRNAKTLFNGGSSAGWQFEADDNGEALADIIDIEKTAQYEANQVDIKYKEVKLTDFNNGLPVMEVVWEPDDTVTLRAASLLKDMTINQNYFVIAATEASTWQFAGYANIEGEIVKYDAKSYRYYLFDDTSKVATYGSKYVTSLEEQKELDEITPEGVRWRNGYDGNFRVTKRGDMGTVPSAHSTSSKYRYTYEYVHAGSTAVTHWDGGVTQDKSQSIMRIQGKPDFPSQTLYTMRSVDTAKAINYRYGTRVRFPSAGQPVNKGSGGLYIKGGSQGAGFYIDLAPTDLVEAIKRTRNELRFQVRTVDGRQNIPSYWPAPVQVNRDTWYDIEAVTIDNGNATMRVLVYIDGIKRYQTSIKTSEIADWFGHFGIFARDNCIVEFDYLYAVGLADAIDPDDASFYDNIKGGYVGTYYNQVIPYQNVNNALISRGDRSIRPSGSSATQSWLDEFGPVVHEIRQYNVDFEKTPVAHSYLYFSNDSQMACPAYAADSFGATFLLANTFRRNVIAYGDDTLTYGTDNSVSQKMFIYGRAFSDENDKTTTVKSDVLIRKRGLNVLSFESTYIQSEATAKRLGDWIVSHWGNGCEQYELTVFGNPFIEIGDIVTINYPARQIKPTTKFCVTRVSNGTATGLSTSLTVRRL